MPFNDTVAVAGSRSVCWRRLCFMGLVEACPFGKSGLLEGELKRGASIVLRHLLSGVAGSSPVFLKKKKGSEGEKAVFSADYAFGLFCFFITGDRLVGS